MREILYRGKCKNNGRWFEGVPFQTNYDGFKAWCISTEPLCANEYSEILGDWAEVIPETVGQYIGANDKNHKEIFEGDIVKSCDNFIYEIRWDNQRAMFYLKNDITHTSADFYHYFPSDLEIIGNIHDNPELLKGGGDNA